METSLSEAIAVVEIAPFLENQSHASSCTEIAESLKSMGAVIIHDPRVDESDADTFLNMMERYFAQPADSKTLDARPHLSYQVRCSFNTSALEEDVV